MCPRLPGAAPSLSTTRRDIAETIAEMLTREGFAVEVATSGEEALAELHRRSYDLVLSDVRMPELDGPALLRKLQSDWPVSAERLIFVTGDTLGLGPGSVLEPARPADHREAGLARRDSPRRPRDVGEANEPRGPLLPWRNSSPYKLVECDIHKL